MTQDNNKIRIVVVGAGKAGELIGQNILQNEHSAFEVVGFIDDDPGKQGRKVVGMPVLGTVTDLRKIIAEYHVDELFIAIPSERGKTVRRIIDETTGTKVVYKILPRLAEVLMQDFNEDFLKYIRKVRVEDMLGGEISKADQSAITSYVKGQVIMITGAAGSIGSELSRQIAAHAAKRVVFYDWWENGMFDLRNQLVELYPEGNFEFIIGDVKDRKKLNQVMSMYKPDTVFHAAAYKHVPLMEHNPA